MRVAVTGASSYSGMCIARAFAAAGHATEGLLSRELRSYEGRQRLRLARLEQSGVTLHPAIRAEDGGMAAWLQSRTIDVWVHHHHPMKDFRLPTYDVEAARRIALEPLESLQDAWPRSGVRAVLFSGTYFEAGEGCPTAPRAVTPYAQLKSEVADAVWTAARSRALSFCKIVIPSPTGALENEDRLTPQLLLAAERGEPFVVRSPGSVFDHIPGEALANTYLEAAEALVNQRPFGAVLRPSGWAVSTQTWCEWVQDHLAPRLELQLDVRLSPPEATTPPSVFHNPPAETVKCDWDAYAEQYVQDWRRYYPFR